MRLNKAFSETLLISFIIPVVLWAAVFRFPMWVYTRHILAGSVILFLAAEAAYSYVVFFRHREQKVLFTFLSALLSTGVQFVMSLFLIAVSGQTVNVPAENGHPDGTMILLGLLFLAEPFILNIIPLCVWMLRRFTRLFVRH